MVLRSTFIPVAALAACLCLPGGASARQTGETGLEIGVLPAINFDSDEGFGYGGIAELYHYGSRVVTPYVWTLQPTVFLTTRGRRDIELFFDAPHLLPDGWRLAAYVGRRKQIATPFYGYGNASVHDEFLEEGSDPYYYRFGIVRSSATFDLQHAVGDTPLRWLFGGGFERATVQPVPEGEGTTLYAALFGTDEDETWLNYIRGGFVWDTRDRETGPRSGAWTEFLVRGSAESLGADVDFIRWTLTDRRYFSLTDDLVFAHRYLVQNVSVEAPVYELHRVQTSFKVQEGLGGAKTVRGLLKNRFVGRGMLVWNSELRWRVADFELLGRDLHAVLSAFLDQGRVWSDGVRFGELLEDLHRGYGAGVRLGMGDNFVVALDAGTSRETGMSVYMGLGYLY